MKSIPAQEGGTMQLVQIAVIRTEFSQKFGIPRQAGLVPELTGRIVFLPEYRDASSVRGLSGYSHIWLLWEFNGKRQWSPTVRPPRLGGSKRMGVFATRSPNRPNRLGLSSVRLLSVQENGPEGPELLVSGADLLDGTRIYDIKPYLPYTDCHPDAKGGFADAVQQNQVPVEIPEELLARIAPESREVVRKVLEQDPRDAFERDAEREYVMRFGQQDLRFRWLDGRLIVTEVIDLPD